MAKGIWISDTEREKILQMRKDGISVSTIAKTIERSTNFIYRILKKANGLMQTKQTGHLAKPAVIHEIPDSVTAAGRNNNDERNQFVDYRTDSNTALFYAVEEMEMPSYEPIAMPTSVKNSEQRYRQVQQPQLGNVDTSLDATTASGISNTAVKHPSVEVSDEFWLLTNTTSSICALNSSLNTSRHSQEQRQISFQPLKKQKTWTAECRDPTQQNTRPAWTPTSSSLLVDIQLQHPQPAKTMMDSTDGLNELLQRIQDEIRRLETSAQADVYETQLLQILVKFHAEILLMQLQKILFDAESSKRARDAADADDSVDCFARS